MRLFAQEHGKQNQHADILRGSGGDAGARDAELAAENQQRVKRYIQHAARHNANHGELCQPLKPQNVVHHEGGGHRRRSNQNPHAVLSGVGENRLCAAEEQHQPVKKQQAARHNQQSDAERHKICRRAVPPRRFNILCAESAADIAARTLSEHEAERLNHTHQAEQHARGSARRNADFGDKIGVRNVVYHRDEHGDNRRHRQLRYQPINRRFRHFFVL